MNESRKPKRVERVVMQRVAKGALLMDNKRPGWWRKVTLRDLDLGDSTLCVLGQDFTKAAAALGVDKNGYESSGYDVGLEALGIKTSDSHLFGFNLSSRSGLKPNTDANWEFLKQCWAAEIATRRRAARAKTTRPTARTNV